MWPTTGDVAVGQPDLVTNTSACTASKLSFPQSAFISGGKLLDTDSINTRVLVWNSIPTASGASADLVLGQADFTHCTANARRVVVDQNNNRALSGTQLFVADEANSRYRYLIYNGQ